MQKKYIASVLVDSRGRFSISVRGGGGAKKGTKLKKKGTNLKKKGIKLTKLQAQGGGTQSHLCPPPPPCGPTDISIYCLCIDKY